MTAPAEEYSDLVARVQAQDEAAMAELVERLTPLVAALASRLGGPGEQDDLFQAGVMGLLKAARRYDPGLNTRFTTYAVPWIQGEIRASRRQYRSGFTVSRSSWEKWRALERARRDLAQSCQREPAISELAAALGISAEEVALILEAARPVASLEEGGSPSVDSWSESALVDRLSLSDGLLKLSPLERELITLRFFAEHTQTEIARRLGLTQRQVSRLEKRILRQLRQLLAP